MKKLFLGLALGGIALSAIALPKVNAAEDIVYDQNFTYTEDEISVAADSFDMHSCDVDSKNEDLMTAKFASMQEGDTDFLRYTIDVTEDKATISASSLNFRAEGGSGYLYDVEGGSPVIKIRFRVDQTYRKAIRLYLPASDINGVGMNNGKDYNLTVKLLEFTNADFRYNVGAGDVTLSNPNVANGLKTNQWYELTSVLEEGGNNQADGQDILHTYLDGVWLYSAQLDAKADWQGKLKDINFQNASTGNFPDQNWDIDYIQISNYAGGTASVQATAEVNVGDSIKINPTVTPSSEYDLSVNDSWTPEIIPAEGGDPNGLTYDSENGFTGQVAGEYTVNFIFTDHMIDTVSTIVTVNSTGQEIKVTGVELNAPFTEDTITLGVGESYDLNNLFTVQPFSATNKELNYEKDSSATYNVEGTVITGLKAGSGKITVTSADGNWTDEFNVVVSDGTAINLPSEGSWTAAGQSVVVEGKKRFDSAGYSSKTFSPISIVKDDVLGNVLAFEGVGGANAGGSYINHWIYADELKANENYKLVVYGKMENPAGKIDIKIVGFTETENEDGTYAYSYDTTNFQVTGTASSGVLGNGWYKIETSVVNFDATRLDGLKIELVSYNNSNGVMTYIGHPQLVAVGGEVEYKGMEASVGNVILTNSETSAPSIELNSVGATSQINVSAIPSAASLANVEYLSSDSDVATISDKGLITAVADGQTIITVKSGTLKIVFSDSSGNVIDVNDQVTIEQLDEPALVEYHILPGQTLTVDGTLLDRPQRVASDYSVRTLPSTTGQIVSIWDDPEIDPIYEDIEYPYGAEVPNHTYIDKYSCYTGEIIVWIPRDDIGRIINVTLE